MLSHWNTSYFWIWSHTLTINIYEIFKNARNKKYEYYQLEKRLITYKIYSMNLVCINENNLIHVVFDTYILTHVISVVLFFLYHLYLFEIQKYNFYLKHTYKYRKIHLTNTIVSLVFIRSYIDTYMMQNYISMQLLEWYSW